MQDLKTHQYLLTPQAGKRLIAIALKEHPLIKDVLEKGTLVIIAGTTNGYIAEEILSDLNQVNEFKRQIFCRGITLPPGKAVEADGRMKNEEPFPGDVVIEKGNWQKGKTIFDCLD
ncbi:MAG: hypothetical protein MJB14_16520, partial [Spirochaetes bacterium]|nr:hypothetical protein [Spirochaetota bacterium]